MQCRCIERGKAEGVDERFGPFATLARAPTVDRHWGCGVLELKLCAGEVPTCQLSCVAAWRCPLILANAGPRISRARHGAERGRISALERGTTVRRKVGKGTLTSTSSQPVHLSSPVGEPRQHCHSAEQMAEAAATLSLEVGTRWASPTSQVRSKSVRARGDTWVPGLRVLTIITVWPLP